MAQLEPMAAISDSLEITAINMRNRLAQKRTAPAVYERYLDFGLLDNLEHRLKIIAEL